MKKIYTLLFSTATLFSIANAQSNPSMEFKKGDKLLGGSLGVNSTDNEGQSNSNTSLSVAPSIGFFTKPNRLTGFSLLYSNLSLSQSDRFSFGASAYRQYWNNLGKNLYFILQASITGTFQKEINFTSTNLGVITHVVKNYTGAVNLAPGFAYRVNHRLLVDAFLSNFGSLYYTHSTINSNLNGSYNNNKTSSNSLGFNSSLNGLNLGNIQIGFRYVL